MKNLTSDELTILRRVKKKAEAAKENDDIMDGGTKHGFVVMPIDMKIFEQERDNYLNKMPNGAS